jgi:hypothetical protein
MKLVNYQKLTKALEGKPTVSVFRQILGGLFSLQTVPVLVFYYLRYNGKEIGLFRDYLKARSETLACR